MLSSCPPPILHEAAPPHHLHPLLHLVLAAALGCVVTMILGVHPHANAAVRICRTASCAIGPDFAIVI